MTPALRKRPKSNDDWSASNTFTDVLVPSADLAPGAVEPDPGP